MSEPSVLMGHAFISYVREDSSRVDQLQRTLEDAGIPVWRDTASLWPGEDWCAKIRHAITDDALAFVACFSHHSLGRDKSYQNEELILAINQLRLRRIDVPWLIPVRLDECAIPDHDLGGGRTLASIQSVDLFGDHIAGGTARLVTAIRRILERTSSPEAYHATKPARIQGPATSVDPRVVEDGQLAPKLAVDKPNPWLLLANELMSRLDLEDWDYHVGGLLRSSAGMHSSSKARLLGLAIWLNGRILPDGQPELRRILSTLQKVIVDLLEKFDLHCEASNPEQDDPWLRTAKFYKIGGWRPSRSAEAEIYEAHINLLSDLALELTRVVNWLCDFVRREFNPMFRFEQGAIQINGGPYSEADDRWFRPEYSPDDISRRGGPYKSLEDFRTQRFSRDFYTGG